MKDFNQLYPAGIINLFPDEAVREWIENGKEINFKKGDDIIKPTGMKDKVFLIKKGMAHLFHMHEDGKECVVGILSRGDFINLMGVFTDNEHEMVARALTDLTITIVSEDSIRYLVSSSPDLAMKLLSDFSSRLQEIIEILSQVAYGKVEERLLFTFRRLIDESRQNNGWAPLSVSITHQDIAGMVASTRETVTLIISKLYHKGIIKKVDNNIWMKIE